MANPTNKKQTTKGKKYGKFLQLLLFLCAFDQAVFIPKQFSTYKASDNNLSIDSDKRKPFPCVQAFVNRKNSSIVPTSFETEKPDYLSALFSAVSRRTDEKKIMFIVLFKKWFWHNER